MFVLYDDDFKVKWGQIISGIYAFALFVKVPWLPLPEWANVKNNKRGHILFIFMYAIQPPNAISSSSWLVHTCVHQFTVAVPEKVHSSLSLSRSVMSLACRTENFIPCLLWSYPPFPTNIENFPRKYHQAFSVHYKWELRCPYRTSRSSLNWRS